MLICLYVYTKSVIKYKLGDVKALLFMVKHLTLLKESVLKQMGLTGDCLSLASYQM